LTLVLPGLAMLASLAELFVTVLSFIFSWPAFLAPVAAPVALAFLTLVFLAWLMGAMLGGLKSRATVREGGYSKIANES
jgi:hypothetical protein